MVVEILLELCHVWYFYVCIQSLVLVVALGIGGHVACYCLFDIHEYDFNCLWNLLWNGWILEFHVVYIYYLWCRKGRLKCKIVMRNQTKNNCGLRRTNMEEKKGNHTRRIIASHGLHQVHTQCMEWRYFLYILKIKVRTSKHAGWTEFIVPLKL